jgi:signal transduction histidine kinase
MRSISRTLPIRWQITVLHATILALVLAGGGLVVWNTQAQFQYNNLLARHMAEASAIIPSALPGKPEALLYTTARPDPARLAALGAKIATVIAPPGASAAMIQKRITLLNPQLAEKLYDSQSSTITPTELQAILPKLILDLFPADEDPAEARKRLTALDPSLAADLFPDQPLDVQVLRKYADGLAQSLGAKDRRAVILDSYGSVLAQSSFGPDCALAPMLPKDALAGAGDSFYAKLQTTRSFEQVGGGSAGLLLPVFWQPNQDRPLALAWLCMPTDAIDASLRQLGASLAAGWALVVGLATLLGVTATRRVLEPLDRVVATTRQIAAGDLHQRVGLPPGRTEIAQLAAAFDTMVARLETAFAAQRRFVADAAHELRTPLTALSASVELLLMGAAENDHATMQRLLRHLDGELSRVIRLTNDLLMLSQLDARPQIDLRSTDLSRVLADIGEHSRGLLRGQELVLDIAPGLYVQSDPDRLRQIVLNLVDNARKYTPAGGTIALRASSECAVLSSEVPVSDYTAAQNSKLSTQNWIRVEVQDTGVGMPAEALPHLFERFYRVDSARARASGGSGLGLAIVQALVQAHRGRINIQSAPNRGTCVTIRLPAGRSTTLQTQEPELALPLGADAGIVEPQQ